MINVKVKETITFELLNSERISGLDAVYYRVISTFEKDQAWHKVDEAIGSVHTLNLQFEDTGNYLLEIKSADIAGNESIPKRFLIEVH